MNLPPLFKNNPIARSISNQDSSYLLLIILVSTVSLGAFGPSFDRLILVMLCEIVFISFIISSWVRPRFKAIDHSSLHPFILFAAFSWLCLTLISLAFYAVHFLILGKFDYVAFSLAIGVCLAPVAWDFRFLVAYIKQGFFKKPLYTFVLLLSVLECGLILNVSTEYWFSVAAKIAVLFVLYFYFLGAKNFNFLLSKKEFIAKSTLALWGGVLLLSLIVSPYYTDGIPSLATDRLGQLIINLIFFIFVFNAIRKLRINLLPLLLIIPSSIVLIAFTMALMLFGFGYEHTLENWDWFLDPPFTSHIRHHGYSAAAGIMILMGILSANQHPNIYFKTSLLGMLVCLCTFVFWMGGRGSMLAVLISFLSLLLVLLINKKPFIKFVIFCTTSFLFGFLLSEALSVFSWNGVLSALERTGDAESLQKVSSGRTIIWQRCWDAIESSRWIGNGPQSYWYMPNRYPHTVQAHSFIFQSLMEYGLLGTTLILGLLVFAFQRGALAHAININGDLDPAKLAAGSVIVGLTFFGLVDGTYYHAKPSFYLVICYAIWFDASSHNKKQ